MAPLHVAILAAGAGTRMRSSLEKVLHPCAGLPVVAHVARAALELHPDSAHVVVPTEHHAFREALDPYGVACVVQSVSTGTADAVADRHGLVPHALRRRRDPLKHQVGDRQHSETPADDQQNDAGSVQ